MKPTPLIVACAMEEEAAPFLAALNGNRVKIPHYQQGPLQAYEGELGSVPTIVLVTGIGLANATVAATLAISHWQPDLYVLAGTTGGLHKDAKRNTNIIGTTAVFHNADASTFGYVPGQIPGMPALVETSEAVTQRAAHLTHNHADTLAGLVGSANSFIAGDQAQAIRTTFPDLLAVDMETAAAAQAAVALGCPWVSLRTVSDLADPQAGDDFQQSAPNAANQSFDLVNLFIGGWL